MKKKLTKLEDALQCLRIARRKNSTALAWDWAEDAAKIADILVYENGNYPDLDRLEKDLRATLSEDPLIITDHPGVVAWLKKQDIEGEVVSKARVQDVQDRVVYGELPLYLAALAARVCVVCAVGLDLTDYSTSITYDELVAMEPHLHCYVVEAVWHE